MVQRNAVVVVMLLLMLAASTTTFALCPMCKKALENSPEGEQLAKGLNAGILVLLATPLLIVSVIAALVKRMSPATKETS